MLAEDLAPNAASSNPFDLQATNGSLYFYATVNGATELWRSDGTAAGTVDLTTSLVTVSTGSFPAPFGVGREPPPADFNGDGISVSVAAKLRRLFRNRRKYGHAPAAPPRCPSKPSAVSQACCIAIS
jgi:ELWxxDGT repeat protein